MAPCLCQSIVGAEGLSLAFRHIASSLLGHCGQVSCESLLHEVIVCVGYFTVNHPDNQVRGPKKCWRQQLRVWGMGVRKGRLACWIPSGWREACWWPSSEATALTSVQDLVAQHWGLLSGPGKLNTSHKIYFLNFYFLTTWILMICSIPAFVWFWVFCFVCFILDHTWQYAWLTFGSAQRSLLVSTRDQHIEC